VSWELAAPAARTPDEADVVAAVAVPDDIEAVRRDAPADAVRWRREVRDELVAHLAAGRVIAGFDSRRGYLLVRPSPSR